MSGSNYSNTHQYRYALADRLSAPAANAQAQETYEEMVSVVEQFPTNASGGSSAALGFATAEYQIYEAIAEGYASHN